MAPFEGWGSAEPKAADKLNDGKGLFLHIAKSGKKSWRYRYELPPGKATTFVIGEYPVLSLEDARSERMALREMIKAGVKPSGARRQERYATIEAQKKEKQVTENSFEAVALGLASAPGRPVDGKPRRSSLEKP